MSLPALNGLNFFMADVRDGLGPFLGVYLQERGWGPQDIGLGDGDPSAATALTVVVAQLTMIPMALLAAKLAQTRGYWIIFVLALVALPIRGLIAASLPGFWVLVPVRILDGIGAGLLGVAVPGLVAQILRGSGHFNLGLGAVMTVQGIGASLSPTLGGWVAQSYGYGASFMALAGVALAVWLVATLLFDGSWVGRGREKEVVPIVAA